MKELLMTEQKLFEFLPEIPDDVMVNIPLEEDNNEKPEEGGDSV